MKPVYDEGSLGDLSEPGARSAANPPTSAVYSQLVAALSDLDAAPAPARSGDAAKRGVLDQLASALGNLSG